MGAVLDFPGVGSGLPTYTTRSAGTKALLWPLVDATHVDIAIGTSGASILWSSVGSASGEFRWYAGTTEVASLTGAGVFTAGVLASTNIVTSGNTGLLLNNATKNLIEWHTAGLGAPTFTTRSAGVKLLIYPAIAGAVADYAIGIETGAMWFGATTSASSFKWYGGTTLAATLTGAGALTLVGGLTAASLALTTQLPVSEGGTGITAATSKGVVYATSTSAYATTAAGTTGQVFMGVTGGNPGWATMAATDIGSGTLPTLRGGTGLSTSTPADGGIVHGTGSALAVTPAGTTGQKLTSAGTGVPTWEDEDQFVNYTPTWTNLTVGNGVVKTRWSRSGNSVKYHGRLTFGSTTSVAGIFYPSLPVPMMTGTDAVTPLGVAWAFDNSPFTWQAGGFVPGQYFVFGAARATTASPWTWATTDAVGWAIEYECDP